MYAKLFSRITESSLMEEALPVRYVFVMLLAVADPKGYVIGTDIALARRLNMPLADFQGAIARLSAPDPASNSPEEAGRRILPSDGERGYRLVNYLKYRAIRDEDGRREYLRNYMADYRAAGKDKTRPVNSVNTGKLGKRRLTQAEAEAEAEAEKDVGQFELLRDGEARPAGAGPASKSTLSDADWLTELQADPAYQQLDVRTEHARMAQWCAVNHKQPTRRRFINWLNRCDKPLAPAKPQEPSTPKHPDQW